MTGASAARAALPRTTNLTGLQSRVARSESSACRRAQGFLLRAMRYGGRVALPVVKSPLQPFGLAASSDTKTVFTARENAHYVGFTKRGGATLARFTAPVKLSWSRIAKTGRKAQKK